MTVTASLIIFIISSLYFIILAILTYFWSKHSIDHSKKNKNYYKVSIIIAVRNEKNIPVLISDLQQQSYPFQYVEIIIVDDHSDEKILPVLEQKNLNLPNLRILELNDHEKGKKTALAKGVKISSGEILIFTDADCRVPPEWISMHVAKYQDENTGMVIGLVDYIHQPGIIQSFFRSDLLSLMIPGAGAVAMKRPLYCNGANLSVKKEIYLELMHELQPGIMTGDDVFLLHSLKRKKSKKIALLKSRDALVCTYPPQNIKEFFRQRSRWVSKSRYYSDPDTLFLGILVILANAAFCISTAFILMHSFHPLAILSCVLKILTDLGVFYSGNQIFKGNKHIMLIPFFDFIYPLYLFFIFGKGNLFPIQWKGRSS